MGHEVFDPWGKGLQALGHLHISLLSLGVFWQSCSRARSKDPLLYPAQTASHCLLLCSPRSFLLPSPDAQAKSGTLCVIQTEPGTQDAGSHPFVFDYAPAQGCSSHLHLFYPWLSPVRYNQHPDQAALSYCPSRARRERAQPSQPLPYWDTQGVLLRQGSLLVRIT